MLRLIGLVVVVLFVLSLAHGERTGSAYDRMDRRGETFADQFTGMLAEGVRHLGDIVFGPSDTGRNLPDSVGALARNLDGLSRSADGASRRAVAQMVLRSCPSLGLVCQPASGAQDDPAAARRRPSQDEGR